MIYLEKKYNVKENSLIDNTYKLNLLNLYCKSCFEIFDYIYVKLVRFEIFLISCYS